MNYASFSSVREDVNPLIDAVEHRPRALMPMANGDRIPCDLPAFVSSASDVIVIPVIAPASRRFAAIPG